MFTVFNKHSVADWDNVLLSIVLKPFIYFFLLTLQEHRTEIDARSGTFQAFELFGQHLLQSNHYASPEVQEKLENMNMARQELEKYVFVVMDVLLKFDFGHGFWWIRESDRYKISFV